MKYEGKVTQHFTSFEEFQKMQKCGIDMFDSLFVISAADGEILLREDVLDGHVSFYPTYTLSEILYKLPEWCYGPYDRPIEYLKDAPFYGFCLYTKADKDETVTQEDIDARIECISEYPLRSAVNMLCECAKKGLGYVINVSDK